jgi:recombination protein RecA
VRVKVVKNKVAPPFRQAEFEISFGQGIDKYGYLIDMAINEKLIDKSGAFFSYKNERLGQGRDNVKLFLHENKPITDEIENLLRQKYLSPDETAEQKEEKAEKEKAVKSGKK